MADIQELADRLAIRDVIDRYSTAVTQRQWDEMGACFHPESRWQCAAPFNMDFSTRKGIQESLASTIEHGDFLHQMIHSVVIDDLAADRAKARVVLNEMSRNSAEKTGFFLLGVYHDNLTKIDGRWGFESRIFYPYYVDTTWLPGTVAVDYAGRR